MKLNIQRMVFLLAVVLFAGLSSQAQETNAAIAQTKTNGTMKTYLIEREIPGAGALNAADLKGISQKSCGVLKEMGPQIKWLHSYVTGNNIFCVYQAESEELLREHAKKGGFPINKIREIKNTISPATAELD